MKSCVALGCTWLFGNETMNIRVWYRKIHWNQSRIYGLTHVAAQLIILSKLRKIVRSSCFSWLPQLPQSPWWLRVMIVQRGFFTILRGHEQLNPLRRNEGTRQNKAERDRKPEHPKPMQEIRQGLNRDMAKHVRAEISDPTATDIGFDVSPRG